MLPDCIPKINTQCMLPKPKPSLPIIYSWCCLLNSPQNQPLSFCEEARRYQFQLMPTTHSFKKPDWLCTEHTNLHSHHQICAGFQTGRKQSPFFYLTISAYLTLFGRAQLLWISAWKAVSASRSQPFFSSCLCKDSSTGPTYSNQYMASAESSATNLAGTHTAPRTRYELIIARHLYYSTRGGTGVGGHKGVRVHVLCPRCQDYAMDPFKCTCAKIALGPGLLIKTLLTSPRAGHIPSSVSYTYTDR